MMDDQLFEFLRDELRSIKDQLQVNQTRIDRKLEEIEEKLETHQKIDAGYWRKIDIQEGQISLLLTIFGGGAIMAILSGMWLWIKTKVGV